MSMSWSSQEDQLEDQLPMRDRCLNNVKNMEKLDHFNEAGPKARLDGLINIIEPIFEKIMNHEMPGISDLFHIQTLKIKNLHDIRNDPKSTSVAFVDHSDKRLMRGITQGSMAHAIFDNHPAAVLTDKKKSRTLSSPLAFQSQWRQVDTELRESYMRQVNQIIKKVFHDCCKELMIAHPMLESALSQIIEIEIDQARKNRFGGDLNAGKSLYHSKTISGTSPGFRKQNTMLASSQSGFASGVDAINVRLDIKSYTEHSNKIKEIMHSYETLLEENSKLRARILSLKSQHDKEQSVYKHTQFSQADREMKLLQEHRLKRNKERMGGQDKSDDVLDEYENKIVVVEFFDALEGIDPDLKQELNYKLAKVRNQFQELLDLNLVSVDKLQNKIRLMNDLCPDAYAIANLSLVEIFLGTAKKESDPARIWKALKRAYGSDYFITVVEEQYGQRFVANYNALYNEVNKVKEQADFEFKEIEEFCQTEVKIQKRIIQELRQEVALFRENFREQIQKIQNDTKEAMERDFVSRESQNYQEQIKREQELQKEIDDRDEQHQNERRNTERIKTRFFFQKLKLVTLASKIQTRDLSENDIILNKIFGFLRGESTTQHEEIEKPLQDRIDALNVLNSDLCDQVRMLDLKNTLVEDQIKLLDAKIFEIGDKITSAENKQMIAYEEKRKAAIDLKAYKMMNTNLESIIDSHRQEQQRLIFELKRFTKGKIRSNVLEAELHRKEKQNAIVKRANEASSKCFVGVDAHKAAQTDLVGIKGQILHLTEKEYKDKFCKEYLDQGIQTIAIEPETIMKIDEHSNNSASRNARNTNVISIQNSNQMSKLQKREKKSKNASKTTTAFRVSSAAHLKTDSQGSDKKNKNERDNSAEDLYKVTGGTLRTLTNHDDSSDTFQGSSANNSNSKLQKTEKLKKKVASVGTMCEILNSRERSPSGTRQSPNRKSLLLKGGTEQYENENGQNSLWAGKEQDSQKSKRMSILKEMHSEDDEKVSEEDMRNAERKLDFSGNDEYELNKSKNKRGGASRKNSHKAQIKSQSSQQLAAGWKIVNERLKDIDALEKRNKSQIKYEVDKAFEMAKYLDETNFTSRDPQTSQAYTSMIQLCMSRLDQLTPFMILQKLETEKNDLQKLLTVDPQIVKQNQSSVAKILNFVCLENLNNQVLRIFNTVIKNSLPSDLTDDKLKNSNEEVQNKSIHRIQNSRQSNRIQGQSCTQQVMLGASNQSTLIQVALENARKSAVTPHDLQKQDSFRSLQRMQFSQPSVTIARSPSCTSMYTGKFAQQIRKDNAQSQQRNRDWKKPADGIIPRKSLQSVLTIKSTNQSSTTKKSPSIGKQNDHDAHSIVKQLIADKQNLNAGIEKTFQSSAQKMKAVEAKLTAARRFNAVGFQSLLTSSKVQGKLVADNIGRKLTQEKRQYTLYREKMKHFMNPSYPQRTSNLFKQGRSGTDIHSSTVLYEDQLPKDDADDYDIALIDMQHPEHGVMVSGEKNIQPAQKSFTKDSRLTVNPNRMSNLQNQTVYNLNPNSTSQTNLNNSDSITKIGTNQKLRQTSVGFFPRTNSDIMTVDATSAATGEHEMGSKANSLERKMPNTSYLDFVKQSSEVGDLHQSTFLESNAYLNSHDPDNLFHPNQKQQIASAQQNKQNHPNILTKTMQGTVQISPDKKLKKSISEIFVGMRCSAAKLDQSSHLTTEPNNESSVERERMLPSLLEKIKKAQNSVESLDSSKQQANYLTQNILERQIQSAASNPIELQVNLNNCNGGNSVVARKNRRKVKATHPGTAGPRTSIKKHRTTHDQ